jgi:hypothetical protein
MLVKDSAWLFPWFDLDFPFCSDAIHIVPSAMMGIAASIYCGRILYFPRFTFSNQINKTKQNKTKQNKTKQNKTKQNKTKQNKT